QQGEQPEEQLELLRHVSHSPQFRCLPCTGCPVSGSRIALAGQRPIGAGGSEPRREVTTPGKCFAAAGAATTTGRADPASYLRNAPLARPAGISERRWRARDSKLDEAR